MCRDCFENLNQKAVITRMWLPGERCCAKELCRACLYIRQIRLVCGAVPSCLCHELSSLPKSCTVKIGMQISWCLLEGCEGRKMRKGIKENMLLVMVAIPSERCKHEPKIWLMRACEGKQPKVHAGPAAGERLLGEEEN